MKRLVYTGSLMLLLLASACQKEVVQPNSDTPGDAPVWQSDRGRNDERGGSNGRFSFTPGGDHDDDGIVDPNGEEEGSDKPGQQQ